MILIPDRRLVVPFPGLVFPMRRQEFWRISYRRNRYLEHAAEEDLMNRARDIISNITELTYDGKIGMISPTEGGAFWIELFTHVLEELVLRGSGFKDGFLKNATVPKPTFPTDPRAKSLLRQIGPGLGNQRYVVKLGKARYLQPAFEQGRWRISPASSYADPSLNAAQRDKELEMNVYLPKSKMKFWDGKTGKFKGDGESLGNIKVTSQLKTDYYVSCLTGQLDLRLFDDFDADSCIVVTDYREFAKRMFAAAKRPLPSWWHGIFRSVEYIDPFRPPKGDLDLFCSKDFRFWYQKEVRFAWIPDREAKNLNHLQLEVGDISDIARFAKL
ncbi:MAG: hypothetical protein ACLP0H_10020 [Terriglobales bacterium]